MDSSTYQTVTLPGEVTASFGPPAPPPEAATKPPFWQSARGLPFRTRLIIGASGLALLAAVGVMTAVILAQPQALRPIDVPQPAAEAPPPAAFATKPEAPAPVQQVALAAPVQQAAPPAPPAPDPLAEHRALLAEATAPVPERPSRSAEDEKLAAMVTALSALMKDGLQAQVDLRKKVAAFEAALGEAASRIAFLEARTAVGSVQAASAPPPPAPAPQPQRQAAPTPPRDPASSATYRIASASPMGAYLLPQDGGAPLTVGPGDTIPGYGRVKAIVQRGTRWVVQAERGDIEGP